MQSQTTVNTSKIMDRIRVLGNTIQVVAGSRFDEDLAHQLDMPEYSPIELGETVYQLVDNGILRVTDGAAELGKGGITGEPVDEDVIVFTVI